MSEKESVKRSSLIEYLLPWDVGISAWPWLYLWLCTANPCWGETSDVYKSCWAGQWQSLAEVFAIQGLVPVSWFLAWSDLALLFSFTHLHCCHILFISSGGKLYTKLISVSSILNFNALKEFVENFEKEFVENFEKEFAENWKIHLLIDNQGIGRYNLLRRRVRWTLSSRWN